MKEKTIKNPSKLPSGLFSAYTGSGDNAIRMFVKKYGKTPIRMITLRQTTGSVIYLRA